MRDLVFNIQALSIKIKHIIMIFDIEIRFEHLNTINVFFILCNIYFRS